ncbi:hypothetical protein BO82DRAFT_153570 [Aspergillus uvarum CBS 121591]|uniref:Zn(2)-C6 fungal-type domain-containing protein n=1 Tax=Aspergillus uvarum CBS 121591 TaxID=1448315 RepID=A0A319C429_9EURO|nr:hypothetical protein BO82DRAFT_153570 [Aspergillus uvarum CBS 121591]PYH78640.1 hypothetical protein BO82DRAFT_153570 [Aspergillus uvarum CBS 121591]
MDSTSVRRVRLACDSCHNMKMKCSGGRPCMTCTRYRHTCIYSAPNRTGRPKGSKNKTVTPLATTDSSFCADVSKDSGMAETWNWDLPGSPLLASGNFEVPTTTRANEFIRPPLTTLSDHDLHTNLSSSAPASLARTYLLEPGDNSSSAVPNNMQAFSGEEYSSFPAPGPPYQLPQSQSAAPGTRANASIPCQKCNCVSVQADSLSSLRKREAEPCPIAFPIVLEATQDIQIRWGGLLGCSLCRTDGDHVALLLLAMSLRLVLRWLQLAIYDRVSLSQEPPTPTTHTTPQHSRRSSLLAMGEVLSPSLHGDKSRSARLSASGRARPRSSNLSVDRIRIGNYELPDEEHNFLMDMLTSRTLARLRQTQIGITTYFQQFQGGVNYSMTGQKKSISVVLDHLKHSIQTTEQLVQKVAH